jgi:hypothetical protein
MNLKIDDLEKNDGKKDGGNYTGRDSVTSRAMESSIGGISIES